MIIDRMRSLLAFITAATLVGFLPAHAQAQSAIRSYEYTPCPGVGPASIVEVAGASCEDARAAAARVVAAPIASSKAALLAAGWTVLRAQTTEAGAEHDLLAVRGRQALRIRRPGDAPDLDGWQAGRELIFSRSKLVGGRPVPSGAAICSTSWLVRVRSGRIGGLSAAHCGGLRSDKTVHRRNVALRRSPQPGIVLGRVQRILSRTKPLDALLTPVPSGINRSRVAVVDRGVTRPPWIVAGLGQPTAGRAVCFTGRTSGIDQCGRIRGRQVRRAERELSRSVGTDVRCTNISARQGDSGGPVFTAPRSDGTVRAVGITTLVVGPFNLMCFTPLDTVLDGLEAKLVVAAR